MKIFYRILLMLFFSIFSFSSVAETNETSSLSTGATNRDFNYSPGHFKFMLPDYWEVIPDKEIRRYKEILRKLYPNKPVQNYVLAIQRKALLSFTTPYALIEIEKRPTPTEKEVEGEALSYADNIRRAYLALYKSNLFGEVKPMPAVYDPKHKVVVGYSSMYRAKDGKSLITMTAIYPCSYGYVRFHFTLSKENEDKYFPVIENIIKSVRFDKGFEFDPSVRLNNHFNYIIYGVVLVLATIWFGMRIYCRRG